MAYAWTQQLIYDGDYEVKYELTKAKYLSELEQKELNRILDKYKDTNIRDTTMLWTALHTGARASEVLAIETKDLDQENKTVFIRGIKGSRDRDIPLPSWLFDRLQSIAPIQGLIFKIGYSRMKQIWETYRPVKKKLHSLRHSFAINTYIKTKDIRLTQLALGHKSYHNTMIYTEYQYSMQELRRLIVGR